MIDGLNTENLEKISNELAITTKIYNLEVEKTLNKAIESIFSDNPEINTVLWWQYSPIWNDGNPCVFKITEYVVATTADSEMINKIGAFDVLSLEMEYDVNSFASEKFKEKIEELSKNLSKENIEKLKSIMVYSCDELAVILENMVPYLENKFGDGIVIFGKGKTPITEYIYHE